VQDVVEVLDRRVGDGMVLVVRVRSADPVQVEPVGVLEDRLLVTVGDRGSFTVPRLRVSGDDEPEALGLRLVDQLASSWGVVRDGTGRTQVWCELTL
jgi:hypothetical protein